MAVYGELGRGPLYINVWKQTVKYLDYVQSSDDDSLLKAAYDEAQSFLHVKNTYLYNVNEILSLFKLDIDHASWPNL